MQFLLAAASLAAVALAQGGPHHPHHSHSHDYHHHDKPYHYNRPVFRRQCPQVDSCAVCPTTAGDLFMLKNKVPHYKADCACRQNGGVLAKINSANFQNATNMEFSCIGPNSYAWIDSWNTDNYNGACLALYTGNQAGGGAISVPVSCENHVQVICQKVHTECDNSNQCYNYVWDYGHHDEHMPCRHNDYECQEWWSSCDSCSYGYEHPYYTSSSSSSSSSSHNYGRNYHHRYPRNSSSSSSSSSHHRQPMPPKAQQGAKPQAAKRVIANF